LTQPLRFSTNAGYGTPDSRPPEQVHRDAIELAVRAEELGYDSISLSEHHFSDYVGVPNPAVVAAAIAARTERIRISINISVLPLHNPVTVAEDYALLDVISGGRLDFGCGRGYQPGEFKGHSVPLADSRDRMNEAIDIVRGLWYEDDFSYAGEHFSVDHLTLFPKPVQNPVPFRVAGVSPESFEAIARMHLPLLCAPSITPLDKVKESLDLYRAALVAEGEDPADYSITLPQWVYIGNTEREAFEAPRHSMEWFQRRNSQLMTHGILPTDPGYSFYSKAQKNRANFDYERYYKEKVFLFGTPDEAVRRLRDRVEYLGVSEVLCAFHASTIEETLENMARFANEVMPAFEREPVAAVTAEAG
jgi:alkanesulfonate monooxygenase SsuD/methylene tetrahydromethanopterin reductase-like flavin-dependent oxidoreductase (luciferase family)